MALLQIIVLALVQGLTEFLPISSSAHLILTSYFLGWQDQGAAFDLALNIGTLLAVLVYFRHTVWRLLLDTLASLWQRKQVGESTLGWQIILATLPAALIGFFLMDYLDAYLRGSGLIALTTIFYALLLAVSERGEKSKTLLQMSYKDAFYIGCAQALALIPGTSRSGVTITAALFLGYRLPDASRFSFLLAIPIIFLASSATLISGALKTESLPWADFMLGAALSFVAAIVTIHYFLKWVNKIGMRPFVYYRLLLGVLILFTLWRVA